MNNEVTHIYAFKSYDTLWQYTDCVTAANYRKSDFIIFRLKTLVKNAALVINYLYFVVYFYYYPISPFCSLSSNNFKINTLGNPVNRILTVNISWSPKTKNPAVQNMLSDIFCFSAERFFNAFTLPVFRKAFMKWTVSSIAVNTRNF